MSDNEKYQQFRFAMPWPPTVNHWHQPIKMGKSVRVIKGSKAREYEKTAVAHLVKNGLSDLNLTAKMQVVMVLHPPSNRKYDIDNRTKGIFDSLSAAKFWVDDDQVVGLQIYKAQKVQGGKVVVIVNELPSQPGDNGDTIDLFPESEKP